MVVVEAVEVVVVVVVVEAEVVVVVVDLLGRGVAVCRQ